MSTYLKWEEPKEFTLKKHKEKSRSAPKFTWKKFAAVLLLCGFFMLTWFLPTKLPQNETESAPPPFGVAIAISIGLSVFILVAVPLIEAKISPPKIRIRITKRGIWLIDSRQNRTWRFADIADFSIIREPLDESFVDVLKLRDFDGRKAAIGVSSQISVETLVSLLSERTGEARNRIKNLQMSPWKSWEYLVGVTLLSIGFLALFFAISLFINLRHNRNDLADIKEDVKKVKLQFESGDPNSLQSEAFGKVAKRAYYAANKTIDIEITQWLMVIGAGGIIVLLLGLNILSWAKSRRLYNRIRKLEVMLLETAASQNKTNV
jgi:hypothetical protein